ncbi:DNA-binding response regulator [Allorhizocola rhizosphaerae]|uniref:response regulator transcription factor n=1 Tax=Allorhizocola rhizosphaerae TaxID=1872709 RepID=UPI000E3BAA41|nr:response regulator transcription factor [Allorhizocola rhizosphaerae]
MQTVLVCVRTAQSAATIAACAERLGVGAGVRTATSAAEAITQLSAFAANIVFADTALTKPDTVGFTRRVLAASPQTQLVLFGPEEPAVAQAAIRAGARGLIGGSDPDPASAAAKALLLVARSPAPAPSVATTVAANKAPSRQSTQLAVHQSAVVPAQRVDVPALMPTRVSLVGRPTRSVALTERELQVLRGMADGRSNAEIGRELFVSEDTVKTHARRLFRKLGARDRAHAVAAGFRAGLVS